MFTRAATRLWRGSPRCSRRVVSTSPSSPSPSPFGMSSSSRWRGRSRFLGAVCTGSVIARDSSLAALVATLGNATADEGASRSGKPSPLSSQPQSQSQSPSQSQLKTESERQTPEQWWEAPTALGKVLLWTEQTLRSLSDVRDLVVDQYSFARDFVSEKMSSARHRLVHRHKKVDIPYYLLPEPLPAGAQKPLTLVLELDLIFKAPPKRIQRTGYEYFLTQTSDFAEIVLVSDQRAKGIFEAMQGLDPLGLISFRLSGEHFFDEHVRYGDLDTFPMRDLARLRRDLRHVVVVTSSPDRYPRHGENVLYVPGRTWHLENKDNVLFELVPLLLHLSQQSDVRRVLPRYDGLDVAALARAHIELDSDEADAQGGGAQVVQQGEEAER